MGQIWVEVKEESRIFLESRVCSSKPPQIQCQNMATSALFSSKYGDICSFFPTKKKTHLIQLARDCFVVVILRNFSKINFKKNTQYND
jgi:hypothetical protein